ncbi:MAG: ribosome small subunit-dependent GTPase A [Bacteroidota bacterium]
MKIYAKETLGWNTFFQKQKEQFSEANLIDARVSAENKNNYILLVPQIGEIIAECTGKLFFSAQNPTELPKTGDWVQIQLFPDENKGLIHRIYPRKKTLSRKVAGNNTEAQIMATNIDKVFIVQGLDHNFNLNRLIRSVVLVEEASIQPIIVLNKADLIDQNDAGKKLKIVKQQLKNVPIVLVSALQRTGIENLMHYIKKGESIVFLGSSGAGKSTLVNALLGSDIVLTGAVRKQDDRGKHTTTRREIFILPQGGILVDTPGTRELQLISAAQGLESTFTNISDFAKECRYKDCTHTVETGCAVLEALETGDVSETQYQNFMKLQREDEYMKTRTDQKAFLEKKAKDKKLHKHIRNINKRRKF